VAAWSKLLRADQLQALSANPWQIFRPISKRKHLPQPSPDMLTPQHQRERIKSAGRVWLASDPPLSDTFIPS
jgi:hypothetical protein